MFLIHIMITAAVTYPSRIFSHFGNGIGVMCILVSTFPVYAYEQLLIDQDP
jgi:hypothetical protein